MKRATVVLWLLTIGALGTTGCSSQGLREFATMMNERGVSHCLFVQGAIPPYGSGYLYGRSGDLDCEKLWQQRMKLLE